MNNWHDKKRLTEQLSFFNHKPKRFISCYAKKPRISMKEAVKLVCNENNFDYIRQCGENALYQNMFNRGIHAQQAAIAQRAAQGQFGGLVGGLVGGLGALCGLAGMGQAASAVYCSARGIYR